MVFKSYVFIMLMLFPLSHYHDFYISICYIKQTNGDLQINYRVFKNDAEVALAENEKENPEFCSNLGMYIIKNFQILEDGRALELQLVDCTNEGSGTLETINCQLLAKNHRSLSERLEINSTVLLDSFDDQVNMIHLQLDGLKKSMNLDRDRKSFILSLK